MELRLELLKIPFSRGFSPGFQKHKESFVTTIQSEDRTVEFCLFCLKLSLPCPDCVQIARSTMGSMVPHLLSL